MASVLSIHENSGEDKHVESIWLPRLDEGSTPSRSTKKSLNIRGFFFLYIPSFMGAHGSVIILGDLKTKGRISRFLRSVKVF